MEEVYKYISKPAFYALVGILIIAIIYSVSPRIGTILAILIVVVGIGNMYTAGIIKPAKVGT